MENKYFNWVLMCIRKLLIKLEHRSRGGAWWTTDLMTTGCTVLPGLNAPGANVMSALLLLVDPSGKIISCGHPPRPLI